MKISLDPPRPQAAALLPLTVAAVPLHLLPHLPQVMMMMMMMMITTRGADAAQINTLLVPSGKDCAVTCSCRHDERMWPYLQCTEQTSGTELVVFTTNVETCLYELLPHRHILMFTYWGNVCNLLSLVHPNDTMAKWHYGTDEITVIQT